MKNSFLAIAYYTKGTGYEKEIENLIASLKRFNLAYDIKAIKSLGSWQKNTQYKALFCKNMLAKHKNNLLYLDADATVEECPQLFEDIKCDIAVHFRNGKELLSSAIYLSNNEKVKNLLDRWIELCAIHPKIWDQKLLQRAIKDSDATVFHLPPEYCCIFDLMAHQVKKPVILQHQASRKYKNTMQQEICASQQ